MKKLVLTTLVLTLFFIISCAKKQQTSTSAPLVQGVKVEIARTASVDDSYEAVGTVRAKNSSVIAARIMGNIVKLHVREGDRVRAGQR